MRECVHACVEMDDGLIQTGDYNGEPSRLQRANLATMSCSRDGAYEFHGAFCAWPTCGVCTIAIRRENAPRWTQAGHVDGKNVGECRVNLEHAGSHAGVCAKLPMLRATCSVCGAHGASPWDDTLGLACTGNHAGSVCE